MKNKKIIVLILNISLSLLALSFIIDRDGVGTGGVKKFRGNIKYVSPYAEFIKTANKSKKYNRKKLKNIFKPPEKKIVKKEVPEEIRHEPVVVEEVKEVIKKPPPVEEEKKPVLPPGPPFDENSVEIKGIQITGDQNWVILNDRQMQKEDILHEGDMYKKAKLLKINKNNIIFSFNNRDTFSLILFNKNPDLVKH